jgi:phage tail sheath protein FI
MVQVSYPGVYIEEVPSGVRTITGVATSITAFIGRALRGSIDEPVIINSFADYERTFGGIWADSMMSYTVRDFYQNGGSQAIIVRIYEPQFSDQAAEWSVAQAAAQAAADAVAQAAADAVAGATTLQDIADAASTAAGAVVGDAAQAAADAVAQAAVDAVAGAATFQDVANAAAAAVAGAVQTAIDSTELAAQTAADAVAQAAADAVAGATTLQDIADAASTVAGAVVGDAAQAAADAVAQAAVDAVAGAATFQDVANAAAAAVADAVQAVTGSAELAAQTAADAVADVAADAVAGATSFQDIADAASTAAGAVVGDAAQAAANAVALAAANAVAGASSFQDIADAATDAVTDAVEDAANTVVPSERSWLEVGNLTLEAVSSGSWGSNLKGKVDHKTRDADEPLPDTNLFNLTVYEDVEGGITEKFLNVSVDANDPRYLNRVLAQESMLVRVFEMTSAARPSETSEDVTATGGSDGAILDKNNYLESESKKTGIYALKKADLFNLLCIPPATRGNDTDAEVYQKAMKLCVDERAMLIVDPPAAWGASAATAAANAIAGLGGLGLTGVNARNAALYFPRVQQPDPKRDGQVDTFVPCGIIAGLIASTDSSRGVWKAPAGLDAALQGIYGLQVKLTDAENGQLNPLGINCLRTFPVNGRVVWGARTLRGADQMADEYKYVPVRRLALMIEESLFRGTKWAVFEPNDEPLWAQIRMNLGAYMNSLFRQGAFQGSNPKQAYYVKCDKETTTQNDINQGIVNIEVGFAPLKPAEFVVIKIQQMSGEL